MNKTSLAILLLFLFLSEISAQDSLQSFNIKPQKKSFLLDDRHWTIEIPIWIPGFYGNYTYGDVSLEGEDGESPSPENPIEPGWNARDIISRLFNTDGNLNFFFLNRISYDKGKFTSQFDAFSGSVGGSLSFAYNNTELVQAKVSTTLLRFYAGYQFYENKNNLQKYKFNSFIYGGTRIHSIKIHSTLNNTTNILNISPLWAEPILGLRNEFLLKRWMFVLQGDIGSFYINDKFSYMLNFYAYFRISKLLSFKLGWCDWDINYSDKYQEEDLTLKMHLSGPATAICFHF